MNIKLIGDKILVEGQSTEVKTVSGLIIKKGENPGDIRTGIVVVVGDGRDMEQGHVAMKVKVGDKIMFHFGAKIQLYGKEYILVNESSDVLIILDPDMAI